MNALPTPFLILALSSSLLIPACGESLSQAQDVESHHEAAHKIVVTTPVAEDVVSTQQYVCQIHSRRHIEVRALERGYLEEIHVQEGQTVKKGQTMFKIVPVLYQATLDSEEAEAEVAQIKFKNTQNLSNQSIVSKQELALAKAELARAQAKVTRARAELNFTSLKAPFDGIVDRQYEQQGSLVEEGDILSTLSDNSVMWVYFNVPEARYLEYKANLDKEDSGLEIELKLANGKIFPYKGEIGAIEADFNNKTGNIAFRADFPNPDGLLRYGQTGTILIHQKVKDAIVIPQRATYEILAKRYVYVIEPGAKGGEHGGKHAVHDGHEAAAKHEDEEHGEHGDKHQAEGEHGAKASNDHGGKHAETEPRYQGVVRQREIEILDEMDDIFLIKKGVGVNDRIIYEGIRDVRDGDEITYVLKPAEEILKNQKNHAE